MDNNTALIHTIHRNAFVASFSHHLVVLNDSCGLETVQERCMHVIVIFACREAIDFSVNHQAAFQGIARGVGHSELHSKPVNFSLHSFLVKTAAAELMADSVLFGRYYAFGFENDCFGSITRYFLFTSSHMFFSTSSIAS